MLMTEEERKVADFYAGLASVEDLTALRKGERLMLQEDWVALLAQSGGPVHAHMAQMAQTARKRLRKGLPADQGITREGERFSFSEFENAQFELLHGRARTVLGDLTDGKPVQLWVSPFWQVTDGVLRITWGEITYPAPSGEGTQGATTSDWLLLGPLFNVIGKAGEQRRAFPFSRCPQCHRIFVQDKGRRRRFCSPNCMTRGAEAARRDQKREYMRGYMAKRRAEEKRRRRKEK